MTETAVTTDLWLKLHGSAETELRRNLRAYFVALGKHLAKPIRAAAEKPEAAGAAKLVSAKEIRTGLTAVVRPFATKQMTAGARDLWQQYLAWKTSRKRPKPSDFTLPREVVKAIEHKAERLLGEPYWLDVAETVRSDLVTALARGVLGGLSGSDLAGEVLAVLGPAASNARAQRIARTECLPGDSVVDGALVTAAYRRWYEGPMSEVVTNTGRNFTGTPNHPMLTLRGWVALGELKETDYLVSYSGCVKDPGPPGDKDVEAPPATIRKIFDALAAVVIPSRERTGKPDFHGDGMDGDVDILRPDRVLRIGHFPPVDEFAAKNILSPADFCHLVMSAACAPFARGLSVNQPHGVSEAAKASAILLDRRSDAGLVGTVLSGQLRGTDASFVPGNNLFDGKNSARMLVTVGEERSSGLRERSRDACFGTGGFYGVSADAHEIGNSLHRLAGDVVLDRDAALFRAQRTARLFANDPCVSAQYENSLVATADSFGDFRAAQARGVQLDGIASLRRIENWRGHVYNLSTTAGYFLCNGLYTGNTTGFLNSGHQASRDVLEADGVLEKKEWMSISDQDTRPAHEQANGQQVANAKMFTVGGEQCMYPGDTRLSAEMRCQCRCTSVAVFE